VLLPAVCCCQLCVFASCTRCCCQRCVVASCACLPAVCCCQRCVVASCVLLPAVRVCQLYTVLLPAVRLLCARQLCVYCERQGSNLGVGTLAAGDSRVVTGRSPPPHRHHCAPTQRRQRLQDLAVNSNP
jgi:hypothetical protein